MANEKVPVMRGAKQTMEAFRYEIACELGLPVQVRSHGVLPLASLAGDIPKRMVALAEQQLGTDGP